MCVSLQPCAFKNLVNARFVTVACAKLYEISVSRQFRAIDPPNPARGFIQQSENVRLRPRAFKNQEMYVLLQRRAQNCMKHVSDVRSSSRHHFRTALNARRTRNNEKVARLIHVLPQFWTSDDQEMTAKRGEGCLLCCPAKPSLREKKEKFLKEYLFEERPYPQQPLKSSRPQQPLMSSHPPQPLKSSHSQQP